MQAIGQATDIAASFMARRGELHAALSSPQLHPLDRVNHKRILHAIKDLASSHRIDDPAFGQMLEQVRQDAARNYRFIASGSNGGGYRNYPDFADIGSIVANLELLELHNGVVRQATRQERVGAALFDAGGRIREVPSTARAMINDPADHPREIGYTLAALGGGSIAGMMLLQSQ